MSSTKQRHLNWTNVLFFTINATVAVGGTILLMVYSHIHWATWLLAGITWVLYGMGGITVGYHRLFSHQAYKAAWPVRLVLLLFGAGAFEGSVLEWCTDHRNHHRYVDTDRDPYSINKGFWYAHIGWIFVLDDSKRNYDNVKDLSDDWMCRFQHKFYVPLAILMGYILPILITCIWGTFLEGLCVAALRIVALEQFTFCINSVCHFFGKKTYPSTQTARDNWFAAFLTFGEGYHNYHHQFPLDYRNGIRFYHYDPSKWVIFSLKALGLASDLNRVSHVKRLRYKIQFDLNQIRNMKASIVDFVQPIYDKVYTQLLQIEDIEKSIKQLKKQNAAALSDKLTHYQGLLKEKNQQLKTARLELKYFIKSWNQVLTNALTLQRKEPLTHLA
jgi:stearoyl-CoA desaturase (Delta-9 desaturase)